MKFKTLTGLLLTVILISISCSSDSSDSNSETGRLTIQLTDAPFPFDLVEEANVTIFKLEARRSDDHDDDDNTDDDSDNMDDNNDSPYITLMEEEIDVNLLELTNGITEQLANLEVPEGTYDLLRIYMKGVNVVMTDGRTFDLKVLSGEQSGLKVFIKPGIIVAGGLSADLLLDFDVSRSFVAKGNTKNLDGVNGFNFKPVIKVSNLSTAGSLTGRISSPEEDMEIALEGAQISVLAADTLNTSGFSDSEGNYTIMGLEAGSYQVYSELEGYVTSDTISVEIVTANKTIQDFQLEKEVIE